MPHLCPVCSECHASSLSNASRSTSAARSASLPLGSAATPVSSTFSSQVIPRLSTGRRLWSLVASMRSVVASFLSPVTWSSPARLRFSRLLFHVSTESNRTPNHALQRTAPRVTARAFCERSGSYICSVSVRSTVGHAPRHAPPSLSLGSLGVARAFFS